VAIGQVSQQAMGLVTMVGMVTIALSTYMITYSHHLYGWLERWLTPFERRRPFREDRPDAMGSGRSYEFVLFGLGRYGSQIGERLIRSGHTVLGVDFDPEALAAWTRAGRDGCFGDATDPEFASYLPLAHARAVISAVPRTSSTLNDADPRLALLHGLRSQGFQGTVAVAMHTTTDMELLKDQGVDVVLTPFSDAADYAVEALEEALSVRASP
jgi:hypothetical protein